MRILWTFLQDRCVLSIKIIFIFSNTKKEIN